MKTKAGRSFGEMLLDAASKDESARAAIFGKRDPDVVKITRCHSCTCYNPHSSTTGHGVCQIFGRLMKDNEFCCYGKERTDADKKV